MNEIKENISQIDQLTKDLKISNKNCESKSDENNLLSKNIIDLEQQINLLKKENENILSKITIYKEHNEELRLLMKNQKGDYDRMNVFINQQIE